MTYHWDDWRLDPGGDLLTRRGQQVTASRKVLSCITHLLAQRHRVVGYDELSRAVWGHGNVTHNQLSQVILAARRTLGDDGHSQRLIQTLPGLGYRWVAPLRDTSERVATPGSTSAVASEPTIAPPAISAQAAPPLPDDASAPPTASGSGTDSESGIRSLRLWAHLALGLVMVAVTFALIRGRDDDGEAQVVPASAREAVDSPLSGLWTALDQARFDDVAKGLAALPPALVESPEARLLEIHLESRRGRFDQAERKLAVEQARAAESADPIRLARLFSVQAMTFGSAGRSGQEVLAPAQAAVRLLESAGMADKPSVALGEALSARGYGYMKTHELEAAMRDLVAARRILLAVGDPAAAMYAADTLARIHMRTGRFDEALNLLNEIASYSRRADNPINEIYALTAATKIEIELLRWDDALASSDRSLQILRTRSIEERRTRVLLLRALIFTGIGRMREAGSLIEEANALRDKRYSSVAEATHLLAAGDAQGALRAASRADAFEGYSANDSLNLESREGALLLWLSAARALVDAGEPMPPLSPSRRALLQAPRSSIGHLARGHWLRLQAKPQQAEAAFREALSQARRMGHLGRMLAATEALVELQLARNDRAAAEATLAELQGFAPAVLTKDYRANLVMLQVALATGNASKAASAHRRLATIAGERRLPADIEAAYRVLTDASARQTTMRN
jgi:DNA-binding winged helix-turn-helix (wHTH) protein/tetratricopeptide (TPR) repeat protein